MWLKRWLLGHPLTTKQAVHERLSNPVALAIFSSDPLSSVAYATEEILLVLVLAGTAALHYSIGISIVIVGLVAILTASYRQVIFAYPSGGGAYVVAKCTLGEPPGLVAAAALLIDYVLTVAVSVAAGIAAITSAVPELHEHRVGLGLLAIVVLTLGNLRGVRESGKIFALPTYLFVGSLGLVIVVGLGRALFGATEPHPLPSVPAVEGLTLFLLLRAFSSGCTALTGIEAISNGVPAFRPPASQNAATTMFWMATILGGLFLGITIQAPCVNFVMASTTVATPVATAPVRLIVSFFRQPRPLRSCQWRTMPAWESVKDRKTPTAYSGINACVSLRKRISRSAALSPRMKIPFENANRSPTPRIWCGRKLSCASRLARRGKPL